MEKINGFGIKYLSDLLNPKKLEKLKDLLLQVYDEILIGDIGVEPEGLSAADALLFANGHNAGYWEKELPKAINYKEGANDKVYIRDTKSYQRKINKYKTLLSTSGADKKKIEVRRLIEIECSKLLEQTKQLKSNSQKCPELTDLKKVKVGAKMSRIDRSKYNRTLSRIDPLFYSDNSIHQNNSSVRKCLVTELDISMQKEDSKFLCTTGVKYFKDNHPDIWIILWKRLAPRWHNAPEEKQLEEIHHSIRNEYFNKIHNTKRRIDNRLKHPALFDQLQLISKDKLEIAGIAG